MKVLIKSITISVILLLWMIYIGLFVKFTAWLFAPAGLCILSLIICPILFRQQERKNYNNGICSKCGGHLYHFDTDSQGGKGYACDKCGRHIWLNGWFDPDENN